MNKYRYKIFQLFLTIFSLATVSIFTSYSIGYTLDPDSKYDISSLNLKGIISSDEIKGENKILRLVLKGSPSLDFTFDIDMLMKEYESKYFFLKIVDNIHVPEDLTEDETIRGTFIKLMKAEIKKEKDEEKRKRLENALRIGIGYLDKRL